MAARGRRRRWRGAEGAARGTPRRPGRAGGRGSGARRRRESRRRSRVPPESGRRSSSPSLLQHSPRRVPETAGEVGFEGPFEVLLRPALAAHFVENQSAVVVRKAIFGVDLYRLSRRLYALLVPLPGTKSRPQGGPVARQG